MEVIKPIVRNGKKQASRSSTRLDAISRAYSLDDRHKTVLSQHNNEFSSPIDSSTPRSRLQSSPIATERSKKQMKVIDTRRELRSNETIVTNVEAKENETTQKVANLDLNEVAEHEVIKPITASASPGKKVPTIKYLSPIEKLLAKNGSLAIKPKKQRKSIGKTKKGKVKQLQRSSSTDLLGEVKIIDGDNVLSLDTKPLLHEGMGFVGKDIDDKPIQSMAIKNIRSKRIHSYAKNNMNSGDSDCQPSMQENNEVKASAEELLNSQVSNYNSMESNKNDNTLTFTKIEIGDICWGQIYTTYFWPCMVTPSSSGDLFKTVASHDGQGDSHLMVHVCFFAYKRRHCWVKKSNMLNFKGLEDYLEIVRKSYIGTVGQYIPVGKQRSNWNEAISIAHTLLKFPNLERCKQFEQIIGDKISHPSLQKDNEPTSDIGSLSDSNESIYSQGHTNINKRERSESPTSPLFSPIKRVKKQKSGFVEEFRQSDINSKLDLVSLGSSSTLSDDDGFNALEYSKFHDVIKNYIMLGNKNDVLERSLNTAIENVWKIRNINLAQMKSIAMLHREAKNKTEIQSRNGHSLRAFSQKLKQIASESDSLSVKNLVNTINQQDQQIVRKSQPKKNATQPIEEVIENIFELDEKYLFTTKLKEPICKYCHKNGGNMHKCDSGCHLWFHKSCETLTKSIKPTNVENNVESFNNDIVINEEESSDMVVDGTNNDTGKIHITSESIDVCMECANGESQKCLVCHQDEKDADKPIVCSLPNCGKMIHLKCLKDWPQAKITKAKDDSILTFRCPSHVCHTCVSDDPRGKFQPLTTNKMVKCTECPATYHMNSMCIPAGSYFLTPNTIICSRHGKAKADNNINVNWCLICVGGGNLTCCDACPTSIHPACLGYEINPDEVFICDECQSGRMPLYGDIVWVKFNTFRWWPAIILPPILVPQNVMKQPHKQLSFVVRFFGTHDHGWVSRRRVYLFAEGDGLSHQRKKSGLDQRYRKAVNEAKNAYNIIQEKLKEKQNSRDNKEKPLPEPYIKIKVNRAVPPIKLHGDMDKVNVCICSPLEESPCGPDSSCLNRCLFQQCSKKTCPAGDRCQNQMFNSKVTPRVDVVYMKERGFGLVCLEPISAGTFIIEYVGEVINDEEFQHRLSQKCSNRDINYYFFSVTKDYIIDAGPRGNLARFMNHSCDPNCETQVWSVNGLNRVGLFAIKDIPEKTELTFNYNWDELLGTQKKACLCGAASCIGEIGGKRKEIIAEPKKQKSSANKKTTVKRLQKKVSIKLQPLKVKNVVTEVSKLSEIDKE